MLLPLKITIVHILVLCLFEYFLVIKYSCIRNYFNGQPVGGSFHTPQGCRFDSRARHMSRMQVGSLSGHTQLFDISLSPCLSL